MSLLPNFRSASDGGRIPGDRRRKKRRIIIRGVTALVLVTAVAASTVALRKSRVPAKYGIENGIITYEPFGEDITEQLGGSEELRLMLSANGAEMYIDGAGAVYYKTAGGDITPLCATEHGFTSEPGEKQSAFSISYLDSAGVKKTMLSYQSIQKKQFRVYSENNSFSVQYLLGDNAGENIIPTAVEKEKFEKKILSKLSESEQAFMKRQYFLYSLSSFTDEKEKKNILLKYPVLKDRDIYVLLNSADADSQVGRKLAAAFKKAGYTAADAASDNAENLISSAQPLSFLITLRYSLDNGCATVTVPMDKLRFYRSTPILGITLNKYTVSADSAGESLFLPYGNGCVIDISEGSGQTSGKISVPVYGRDAVLRSTSSDDTAAVPKCTVPVFGSYGNGKGMLEIIESGASQAKLNCERNSSGAYSYAEFEILQSDTASLSGKTASVTVGNEIMSSDITLRYAFFEKDEINYSDFAEYYRQYLEERGILKNNGIAGQPVFSAGFICGVTVADAHFNTFPYDRFVILSDYSDIKNMTDKLAKDGVSSISADISGWTRGGLFAQIPGKARSEKSLSATLKSDEMYSYFKERGIDSFTSSGFAYYYAANGREGKYGNSLTAQFADKSYASKRSLSPVTKAENQKSAATDVISPYFFEKIADKYISSLERNTGIGVGHLTDSLNSDYNTKHYSDRSRSEAMAVTALKKLASSGRKISSADANQYALPYVSLLTDISDTAVLPDFIDYDVPFRQMLLRGSVEYTQAVTNDINGSRHGLLKAIESGAGLHFDFIARADIELKNSEFSYLNNYDFERTEKLAAECYSELKTALGGLEGVKIVSHRVSDNGVREISYENGTVISVNFSDSEKSVGDRQIDAFSYLRTDK